MYSRCTVDACAYLDCMTDGRYSYFSSTRSITLDPPPRKQIRFPSFRSLFRVTLEAVTTAFRCAFPSAAWQSVRRACAYTRVTAWKPATAFADLISMVIRDVHVAITRLWFERKPFGIFRVLPSQSLKLCA